MNQPGKRIGTGDFIKWLVKEKNKGDQAFMSRSGRSGRRVQDFSDSLGSPRHLNRLINQFMYRRKAERHYIEESHAWRSSCAMKQKIEEMDCNSSHKMIVIYQLADLHRNSVSRHLPRPPAISPWVRPNHCSTAHSCPLQPALNMNLHQYIYKKSPSFSLSPPAFSPKP